MIDPLQKLQLDVAAYLATEASDKLAAYHYTTIIVTNPRAEGGAMGIQDTINQAMAGLVEKNGKLGLAVVVRDPDAGVPKERMRGPFVEMIIELAVIENKLMNMGATGTLVPAGQLAMDTLSALHGWNPGGMAIPLRGMGEKALERLKTDDDNVIMWIVTLRTEYQIRATDATEAPRIATDGGLPAITATLSCPDAGAAIYYSLDGSFPTTLYSAPFVIEEACTIRAIAILSGFLPSEIVQRVISPVIGDTAGVPIQDTAGGGIEDTFEE